MKINILGRSVSFLLITSVLLGGSLSATAQTQNAEITNVNVEARDDFILEPAKMEILLDPGETATRYIYVTSRINAPTRFRVDIEDFIGSQEADRPVVLLGNERSPYSLKDYLQPAINEFTLGFGQKIKIPVLINLPPNAEPGGFYASVLISNEPEKQDENTDAQGQARTVSRVGSLLFVRVNGPVTEEGKVDDFRIKGEEKTFYNNANFSFEILFNNTGTVHLIPYGTIEIKNIWGKVIETIPVDAYFALPDSLRYREVSWNKGGLLGRYTATLNLNRGYGGQVDTQSLTFWIVPWKIIAGIFVVILVLLSAYYYISRNFEFKKRNRKDIEKDKN
jgi:hypothetical protein